MNTLLADPLGFPMVWVPDLGAYVHWLPVAKLQFEFFLCDLPDGAFRDSWYAETTAHNPRLDATQISSANYWRALISGIDRIEAQKFAAWCGDGYRLPTDREWELAYDWSRADTTPLSNVTQSASADNGSKPRRALLLARMDAALRETAGAANARALGGLALMELGLLEWVQLEATGEWKGRGAPHPHLFGNLLSARKSSSMPDPDDVRKSPAGFRLLYEPYR